MKEYRIYRNIRRRALIFGLPVSFFAIQMTAVIASLLIIIFTFGITVIIGAVILNGGLYIGLLRLTRNPQLFSFQKTYPNAIRNSQSTSLSYESD